MGLFFLIRYRYLLFFTGVIMNYKNLGVIFLFVIACCSTACSLHAAQKAEEDQGSIVKTLVTAALGLSAIDHGIRRENSVLSLLGRKLHRGLGLRSLHTSHYLKKIGRFVFHLGLIGTGIRAFLPGLSNEQKLSSLISALILHTLQMHVITYDNASKEGASFSTV